ncbi:hypothetical protein NLG97_g887 [Lecanicillium saksenae]|uniref:Uncharacterized protein n=1 Tax=Lecanicillium saksenae TaxID=468837 RepID=A0ACC1R783_9HYPO|nr:hypothetical protein NLG97_g887 [Lecanicillium saksenae]
MSEYKLSVHSLNPPTLPEVPEGTQPSEIRSGMIPGSFAAASSPMRLTVSLPGARPNNPLHPATHLQLTYLYPGTGEIYVPEFIMPEDVVKADDGDEASALYNIEIAPRNIVRVKVNEGETPDAEVRMNAWRNEKILGKFTLGVVEGLGIEGLKSFDVAKRRVEAWKEQKKAAQS